MKEQLFLWRGRILPHGGPSLRGDSVLHRLRNLVLLWTSRARVHKRTELSVFLGFYYYAWLARSFLQDWEIVLQTRLMLVSRIVSMVSGVPSVAHWAQNPTLLLANDGSSISNVNSVYCVDGFRHSQNCGLALASIAGPLLRLLALGHR